MHKNFIIAEKYKSQHFVPFHFIFAVDYICDKKCYTVIRKMTVVHPRAHATANMTNVKGGHGKEIIYYYYLHM